MEIFSPTSRYPVKHALTPFKSLKLLIHESCWTIAAILTKSLFLLGTTCTIVFRPILKQYPKHCNHYHLYPQLYATWMFTYFLASNSSSGFATNISARSVLRVFKQPALLNSWIHEIAGSTPYTIEASLSHRHLFSSKLDATHHFTLLDGWHVARLLAVMKRGTVVNVTIVIIAETKSYNLTFS